MKLVYGVACLGAALLLATLSGCGSSASKGAIRMASAVAWPNICKRVTIDVQNDAGESIEAPGETTYNVEATGGAVYATNTCTGTPVTSVVVAEGLTSGAFFVKAGAVGTMTVTVSDSAGTKVDEGSIDVVTPKADLVLGQPDFTSSTANNGGIGASSLSSPYYATPCGDGLAVVDYDNSRVLLWNASPTTNGQAADVVVGQANFTATSMSSGPTSVNSVEGVACPGDRLVVADTGNNRLMLFNARPTTNGGAADMVMGQSDLNSSGTPGAPGDNNFSSVGSVMPFGMGGFMTSDDDYERVLVWATWPGASNVGASLVLGQANFTDSGTGSGASGFDDPYYGHQTGDYVVMSDCSKNRVLVFSTLGMTNNSNATLVVGQPDFATTTLDVTASKLNCPSGAEFDGDHLWVADYGNSRILVWNGMPTTNGQAADVVIGAEDFDTAGSALATDATFDVWGMRATADRGVWVSDYSHSRVLRFPSM